MTNVSVPESADASAEKKKGRWGSVYAMAFALIVDNTEGGVLNSLFPVIRDSLGLSLTSLGVFTGIARGARMIFGPIFSMIADKYGRKRILVFVTGIWGIWTVLAGFAQSYSQLLILYSIGAIGTVAGEPIIHAVISNLFETHERGKAFGVLRSLAVFIAALATPLIGQLANVPNHMGWRYGMYIMGGLSILSGILIAIFVRNDDADRVEESEKNQTLVQRMGLDLVPELLKIKTVRRLSFLALFDSFMALIAYFVIFLVDERGFTTPDANNIFAVFVLGFAISSLLGGFLGDVFEKKNPRYGRVLMNHLILTAAVITGYLGFGVTWSTPTAYFIIFIISGLISGLGFSGANLPIVSAIVPLKMRSTAFAFIYSFVQGGAATVYALLAGFLADRFGLEVIILSMTVGLGVIKIFLWFLIYKPYMEDSETVSLTEE